MYCQLGNIVFTAHTSFTDFNSTEEAYYAEHALLNRKPLLEPTGLGLKVLNVGVLFRQNFCNVKDSIAALTNIKNNYDGVPLVWGNGDVEGYFVITSIVKNHDEQLTDGSLVACSLTVQLKEYVPDLVNDEANKARKNAPAVNTTPAKRSIANKPTCSTRVSKNYAIVERNYKELQRLSTTSAYDGSTYTICDGQNAMNKMLFALDPMQKATKAILDETALSSSCVYNDLNLQERCRQLIYRILYLRDLVKSRFTSTTDPLPDIKLYVDNMGSYVRAVKEGIDKYLKASITRRG